jgi:Tol biopolymer transport system component
MNVSLNRARGGSHPLRGRRRRAAIVVGLASLVAVAMPGTARTAFPGSNGKIVFVSGRDGHPQIYTMNADGSAQKRLTNGTADDLEPAWSPDGTKIAFTRTVSGSSEIYVMNADGSGQTNLTRSTDPFDGQPAWSPNGTRIAFVASVSAGGPTALFVMNADGTGKAQVGPTDAHSPAWSPDGRKLAFQAGGAGGFFDVWVVVADGSFGGLVNRTNHPAADVDPSWSANGQRIYFSSSRAGKLEIYEMNADGSVLDADGNTVRRLTTTADVADTHPAGSPDGTQIAFTRTANSGGHLTDDIYRMSNVGLLSARLTNDGLSVHPDWGPGGETDAPVIACGSADTGWRDTNKPIACTASDAGIGLANPADAAFSLSTTVPAGSEDANALTTTRDVCDRLGNCATAGPIGGNKIDRKAPTLALPPDVTLQATSADGEIVTFSVSAADGADPSPRVSCSSASGSVFPIGTTHVACTATDHVGNSSFGLFTVVVLSFNTAEGSGVAVRPVDSTTGADPLSVVFANVTRAGHTTLTTGSTGPAPTAGFEIQGVYYELATTAEFDSAEICFPYTSPPAPPTPAIMHWVGPLTVIEPASRDTGSEVCAVVTSFSPFALVVPREGGADTAPPVIACGSPDGAWHAGNVSIACSAHDDGSGLADPAGASFTLSTSVPAGTETGNAATGSRQVCDAAGNCATAGPIAGNRIDRKAPTLTVPVDRTVNATSAAGAAVTFSASASDGADPSPSVTCTPASGSVFPIGTTHVACTATDHVGNAASGGFTLTVTETAPGAKELLTRLIQDVVSASKLPPAVKTQLIAKLQSLAAGFDPGNPAQRKAVCTTLTAFTAAVRLLSGHAIPPAQATAWIADANRIRAVLAC